MSNSNKINTFGLTSGVSIFTVDGFTNKTVARTTIELDGDTLCIITPEFLKNRDYLSVHNLNAYLGQHIKSYQLISQLVHRYRQESD